MEKYENMVSSNRIRSQKKIDKAIAEIKRMLNDDEQVVICTLIRKTGLSRAFFYNNKKVHSELVRAQELQEGKSFVEPQKVVINKAMDREIELLKKKLAEKERENDKLKSEVIQLKKAAKAQALSVLENL